MAGNQRAFHGPTAAFIIKLDGIQKPTRIDVAMHVGCREPAGLRVRRLQEHDRPHVRNVFGFKVPETERVLLDCATALSPGTVGLAMDDALRRKMTSVARLRSFASERCGRGVRGSKVFRVLVESRDANDEKVRTVFETRMLRILKRIRGLELHPDFHVRVGADDYFIDFYLPRPRLGIECPSVKWHGTDRSKHDVVRDRRIRSTGIDLLYFSYDDVVLSERETEREIRAAVARRLSRAV